MTRTDRFTRLDQTRAALLRQRESTKRSRRTRRRSPANDDAALVAVGLKVASSKTDRADLAPEYERLADEFDTRRRQAKVFCAGMVSLHVSVSVPLSEMATWDPERIGRYMRGIAQVRAAISGGQS